MRVALLATAENNHAARWAEFLARRGHEVLLLSDRPARRPLEGVRVECPRMGLFTKIVAFKLNDPQWGNNRFKYRAYLPHITRFRPDVVHAMEALGYGPILAHVKGAARVLTPWGTDVMDWPKRSPVARSLAESAIAAAHRITTNAPGLETELLEGFRVEPRRIHLFSWGIDLSVFRPAEGRARVETRAHLNVSAGARMLLSPRNAKPYWGVPLLVRGWLEWKRKRPALDAVLVVIRGSATDAEWADVGAIVAESPVAGTVRAVHRYLTPEEMAEVYAASDAFVSMPETDLLAMSVLEGMACGSLPILADLPAYRGRVADLLEERAPVRGIMLRERSEAAVGEALDRWQALDADMESAIRCANTATIRAEENFEVRAEEIFDVYREAIGEARMAGELA